MLEFYDGFDNYTQSADLTAYGWLSSGSSALKPGRFTYSGFPSNSLEPNNSSWSLQYSPNLYLPSGALASRTIGFAWLLRSGSSAYGPLITLWSGNTAQFSLCYTGGTAQLFVQQGTSSSAPSAGETCSGTYLPNQWYYIEVQFTLNGASSSVSIQIDGINVLTATGLNLDPAGSATANILSFNAIANGPDDFDDVYVVNPTGSAPTSFLGVSQIIYCPPTADSTHGNNAWAPNSGTTEYTQVNGQSESASTTYINATAVGAASTFGITLPAFNGTIDAVKLKACVKQTDAGVHTVAAVFETSGTNYVSSNTASVGTNYAGAQSIMTVNPATSHAFTAADVTTGEIGITVVS